MNSTKSEITSASTNMSSLINKLSDDIFQKYGKEHVAHIVIFQRIKAKMAIRDVGRILGMEKSVLDNISKLLLLVITFNISVKE